MPRGRSLINKLFYSVHKLCCTLVVLAVRYIGARG
ncbi:hypothetical protein CPS_0401 [Colwellia psychrerythraea 34H]|uniref:Uncharacterized protein n=1 Tax=Colwellia psychrerythraea (strain 34H / ATCC BAA-681) TaxID=167879 RepID=Q489V5_COLP3|nr:hypothetical protein CPS_0401 [Colwellia psychrerythraea 34H]